MCGFLTINEQGFTQKEIEKSLNKIVDRGPDDNRIALFNHHYFGFNRLSIMDLSTNGMQPFNDNDSMLVCNGEIYNYPTLKKYLEYDYQSESDCEVLLPLYKKYGIKIMSQLLDGEFAFALYDNTKKQYFAARDPMGIRPMFYGYSKYNHEIAFASEAKVLLDLCDDIMPFPPGYYYDGAFKCYNDLSDVKQFKQGTLDEIGSMIKKDLVEAVLKRLQSDAPIGYLLSGGLDSSLVCAIASKHTDKPIKTFAIGMDKNPIDLKYAKETAEYIGSNHTEVIMTKEDVLSSLKEVIYHLETWDITTIRASLGMYIICKYINEHTDLKVLMTGEVSDEMFGYKYTDYAPSPKAFQEEAAKRIKELYMYDVLRADRCISSHELEGRVPFADTKFVQDVMSIDPELKMNKYNKGKYLLRYAFINDNYLPEHILMREKAAFSDAVGHSMVDYLKEYAEDLYSDDELKYASSKYPTHTPFTKESLLYRDIFEEFYPGKDQWIKDYWMPNKSWEHCDVDDPSARVLDNYGESGQ